MKSSAGVTTLALACLLACTGCGGGSMASATAQSSATSSNVSSPLTVTFSPHAGYSCAPVSDADFCPGEEFDKMCVIKGQRRHHYYAGHFSVYRGTSDVECGKLSSGTSAASGIAMYDRTFHQHWRPTDSGLQPEFEVGRRCQLSAGNEPGNERQWADCSASDQRNRALLRIRQPTRHRERTELRLLVWRERRCSARQTDGGIHDTLVS